MIVDMLSNVNLCKDLQMLALGGRVVVSSTCEHFSRFSTQWDQLDGPTGSFYLFSPHIDSGFKKDVLLYRALVHVGALGGSLKDFSGGVPKTLLCSLSCVLPVIVSFDISLFSSCPQPEERTPRAFRSVIHSCFTCVLLRSLGPEAP